MAYLGTSPSNGVRRRFIYTATANQTSFSGNDDNGTSLVYVDVAYLDVYQNGVKLKSVSDYASTTGTSVVLVQGASADDVVEIISFDVFSIGDTVSAADGGSFGGNIGMGGTLAVTGNTTVGGTLAVTGASTLTGALSAKGGVVFNEDSVDVDFRVESNNDANAFVVEGSTGNIGFGIAAPAGDFHLTDAADIRMLFTSDQTGNTASDGTFIGLTDGGIFNIFNRENTSTKFTNNGVSSMNISGSGMITQPLQPAFLVRPASTQANLAINTVHAVVFGSEVFDQNADFASNVFTAPTTGKYQLNVYIMIQQMDLDTDFHATQLVTSNRNYTAYYDNNDHDADNSNGAQQVIVVLTDMDAGDTARVTVTVPNSGAAQTDITADSAFSGYLVA